MLLIEIANNTEMTPDMLRTYVQFGKNSIKEEIPEITHQEIASLSHAFFDVVDQLHDRMKAKRISPSDAVEDMEEDLMSYLENYPDFDKFEHHADSYHQYAQKSGSDPEDEDEKNQHVHDALRNAVINMLYRYSLDLEGRDRFKKSSMMSHLDLQGNYHPKK